MPFLYQVLNMISPQPLLRFGLICIALTTLALTSGCKSLSNSTKALDDAMPWNSEQAAKRKHEESASRIVAIWAHDVLSTPTSGAVQGFGGRMYFYNRKQEAVEVEGQLVVYAFDDTNNPTADHSDRQPNRKYVFRADQLSSHLTESELGPSYSFWIPWQKLGGHGKKVSLVPVFIPTDGNVINGLFSKVTLPGNSPNHQKQNNGDRLVNAQQQRSMRVDTLERHPADDAVYRRNTQTINVSPSLSRHMAAAPQQVVRTTNATSPAPVTIPSTSNALPNYDDYNARRRPTGIKTTVNPSGLKTIKLGPPQRP